MSPRPPRSVRPLVFLHAALAIALGGCVSNSGSEGAGTGGGSGGDRTNGSGGGPGSGGAPGGTGGATGSGGGASASGGAPGSGGATGSGGAATGTGGATNSGGGTSSGGTPGTGGATGPGGRTGTGGGAAGTGGATGTGGAVGAGGAAGGFAASFYIGADITDQETQPVATRANLLTIMKSHGFNYVRLRTFVDPKAADGYDKTNGYDDIAHTVAFGKQVKDAGMGLLIDFHYSDNWADPGKQCVPVAWQTYTTIADLATAVHDYTKDAITQLVAGGARPDMVQIGNETTPGMLIHVCDSGGQPMGNNAITGSTSNWTNLGMLLKAGVQGVKDVDTGILISCHIDRGGDKPADSAGAALQTSVNWITNAMKQGVALDAFGESSYQKYQGDPNSEANTKTTWTNTFGGVATKFPNLKLFAAEYGPLQRDINDVLFGLPNQQGIGTFNWEPTTQGDWNTGHDLLRRSGTTYTAQPDLALYDQMAIDYASRL
jgi:arabinogalactan endo-1,4-beta-galactosidase